MRGAGTPADTVQCNDPVTASRSRAQGPGPQRPRPPGRPRPPQRRGWPWPANPASRLALTAAPSSRRQRVGGALPARTARASTSGRPAAPGRRAGRRRTTRTTTSRRWAACERGRRVVAVGRTRRTATRAARRRAGTSALAERISAAAAGVWWAPGGGDHQVARRRRCPPSAHGRATRRPCCGQRDGRRAYLATSALLRLVAGIRRSISGRSSPDRTRASDLASLTPSDSPLSA